VALKEGQSSMFVAVESVYSMDGTVALTCTMVDAMDKIFPVRNGHLVVDEAHATGIYGPEGTSKKTVRSKTSCRVKVSVR
jgi:8-amino-7-oxononanoate synthase